MGIICPLFAPAHLSRPPTILKSNWLVEERRTDSDCDDMMSYTDDGDWESVVLVKGYRWSVVLGSIKASPNLNTTSTPQVMKPRVIQPYEYTCNSLPLPARLTLLTNIIGEHLQRLCNDKAKVVVKYVTRNCIKWKGWTITSRFLAYRRRLWLTPCPTQLTRSHTQHG